MPTIKAYFIANKWRTPVIRILNIAPKAVMTKPFVNRLLWSWSSSANLKIAAKTLRDTNGASIATVVAMISEIPKSDGDNILV